jgi:chemotaxis signal transduction protein
MTPGSGAESGRPSARSGGAPEFVREILRRRADALRVVPPEGRDEDTLVWVAVCSVGNGSFAFLLSALRGILPLGMITPVPLAGPSVVGVTRFQGQLVTVFSLAALLGDRSWAIDPTNLLVLDCGDGLVAVDCTEVPRSVALPARALESARDVSGATAPVQATDGEVVQLIDVARLVKDARASRKDREIVPNRSEETEVVRGDR